MKTLFELARSGKISAVMELAADIENVTPETVCAEISAGRAVLPCNPAHSGLTKPALVGRSFRTKVNANIGCSTERSDSCGELGKLSIALRAGADAVMDLSVGSNLASLRSDMLKACCVPLGTVPIYEAVLRAGGNAREMTSDMMLDVIREHAEQGVDFMTIHAGILRGHINLASKRLAGIVSRGGSILADWMIEHDAENPLYERWQDVLDICYEHDVTISLGDGLRPGCLADASDEAQFAELDVLGMLVRSARKKGVQVMVEGPGHIPFDQIRMNVERARKVCDDAPFYVLGPIVTDVAPGYDHITACIGATEAATCGASLLCYVTPSEHLGLPTESEVWEGVMAFRIAAHAADVAMRRPGARQWDDSITRARVDFDWKRQFELAIDGDRAKRRFEQNAASGAEQADYCSMCGPEFCAMRISRRISERLQRIDEKDILHTTSSGDRGGLER